jgi:hypothetical protein
MLYGDDRIRLKEDSAMAAPVRHVVFNSSAAGGLRDALNQAGRDERVISLFDCLSFGPINPPDARLRAEWVEKELGHIGWDEVVGETTSFWTEALSRSHRKVVWFSRRSAQEYAGFLEWLWRLGDEPADVIDLTDVMVRGVAGSADPVRAISLALLPPRAILENGLLDDAKILNPDLRARYREQWLRLRTDNAPLRVLNNGELASAALSYFDPLLLSLAAPEWQKTARIIGQALTEFWDTSVLQTGDLVLSARARALVKTGRLESRGDLSDIQRSELRLPSRQLG